jgi:lipoprotein NlpI
LNESINALEQSLASSQNSHQFTEESEFYLALAYLKAKDLSKAQPLFEQIHSNPNHLFHDKVSTLFMKRFYLLERKSRTAN